MGARYAWQPSRSTSRRLPITLGKDGFVAALVVGPTQNAIAIWTRAEIS
jgi:hypothetical protein